MTFNIAKAVAYPTRVFTESGKPVQSFIYYYDLDGYFAQIDGNERGIKLREFSGIWRQYNNAGKDVYKEEGMDLVLK